MRDVNVKGRQTRKTVALIIWLLLAAAVVAVIFHFSGEPATVSAETSAGFLRRILTFFFGQSNEETVIRYDHLIRKTAHFTLFASFGLCLCAAMCNQSRLPRVPVTLSAGAVLAVTDEVRQSFVPGRATEWKDMLIDFSGVACGMLAVLLVVFLFGKIRHRE